MPVEKCPCEKDVAVLIDKVSKLDASVHGNGKDGLVLDVDRLKKDQDDMMQEVSTIARAMSDLADTQKKEAIIAEEKEKNRSTRNSALRLVGIVASIIFGAVATLYIILDHISA